MTAASSPSSAPGLHPGPAGADRGGPRARSAFRRSRRQVALHPAPSEAALQAEVSLQHRPGAPSLGGLWRRTSLQLRTRLLPGPAGEAPPPPGAEAPRPRVPHRGVSNLDDVQLLRERPAGRASLQDQRARAPASRREVGPLGGQEVRALPGRASRAHTTRVGALEGPQDRAPLRPAHHWHRDFNATQNMRAIYYSLLETGQRPEHLRRPEAGSATAVSQQKRGAAPRVRSLRGDVSSDRPTKRTKLCSSLRCLERA